MCRPATVAVSPLVNLSFAYRIWFVEKRRLYLLLVSHFRTIRYYLNWHTLQHTLIAVVRGVEWPVNLMWSYDDCCYLLTVGLRLRSKHESVISIFSLTGGVFFRRFICERARYRRYTVLTIFFVYIHFFCCTAMAYAGYGYGGAPPVSVVTIRHRTVNYHHHYHHGEDGSRSERPLYPRNRRKITNTCYKIR